MNARTFVAVAAFGTVLAILLFPDVAFAAGGEGDAHGPPWVALGLHLFNLLLLLGIIGFFAGGKIKEVMKTRSVEIKREIDESNRLRKQARDRFEELEARLAGFQEELATMKAEAEQAAVEEREAILERADREAARVAEAAERTIRNETAKARMALRRDAVSLAVAQAERQLRASAHEADDTRLAADFFSLVADGTTPDAPAEAPHG